MGKPKVEDPQKVSLKLPSPIAQRLKIEAVEKRTIEAFIVRDALELYWRLAEKQALISKVMEQDLENDACRGLPTVECGAVGGRVPPR